MRRSLVSVLVLSLVLVASACSPANEPAPAGAPVPPPASAPNATSAAPAPNGVLDASSVLDELKSADLGLTRTAVQDEDTDPNNLLGRPNGYTSRASADLPGGDKNADKGSVDRGLVVEVFATAEQAKARSDYIQGLQKDNPILGTEWHYTAGDGTALVRVSGDVKPSLAKKVEAAVTSL